MSPRDQIEGQSTVLGDVCALQSAQSTEKRPKIVDFGHLDTDLKACGSTISVPRKIIGTGAISGHLVIGYKGRALPSVTYIRFRAPRNASKVPRIAQKTIYERATRLR